MSTHDAFDAVLGGRRGRGYVAPTAAQFDHASDELDNGDPTAALALIVDAATQRALAGNPELAELAEQLSAFAVEQVADDYEEETLGAAALLTLSRDVDVIRTGNRVHIVTERGGLDDAFSARLVYACGGSERFEFNAHELMRRPAGSWASAEEYLRCPPCVRSRHATGLDEHDRFNQTLVDEIAATAVGDVRARLSCPEPPASLDDLDDAAYEAWTRASTSVLASWCERASARVIESLTGASSSRVPASGSVNGALTSEDWNAVCVTAIACRQVPDARARVRAELTRRLART